MTWIARESATASGRPVEVFRFAQGATVTALTSADAPVTVLGTTYQPAIISHGPIGASDEAQTRTLDVFLPEDHPLVAPMIRGLTPVPVSLIIYAAHRDDLTRTAVIWQGRVAGVSFGDRQATLRCTPLQSALTESLPRRVIGRGCMWMLYRSGCGVAESAFTHPGTVVAITPGAPGPTVQVAGAPNLGPSSTYYRFGTIRVGEARVMVASQAGDLLTLLSPMPQLAVGAPVSLVAGCDRTAATCAARFNNLPRFGGFPALPLRNPFDRLDS